jgi:hypothetical protein
VKTKNADFTPLHCTVEYGNSDIHYSKNISSHFFELRYFFYILRDLNQTWNKICKKFIFWPPVMETLQIRTVHVT